MQKKLVFMFSGQGSQFYHMGEELLNLPAFRSWMLTMDELVRSYIGCSVLDQMYHPQRQTAEPFNRTLFTHPAIFMVEYALAQVLLEKGIKPDCLIGASLGEYTATAISGSMGLEDVLECILKQAEILETHCKSSGMLAILANPDLYNENPRLFSATELVAINYHSHFVISGENGQLGEIMGYLKQNDLLYWELPVSFGFHSWLIDPAQQSYLEFLQSKTFQKPAIALVSCLAGDRLTELSPQFFWEVVRRPICFREAIQKLETEQPCIYLDLGPSGTLANFTKYNLAPTSTSEYYTIISPFRRDLANLKAVESLF